MSLEHRPFRVAGRVLAVLVATLAAGCGGGVSFRSVLSTGRCYQGQDGQQGE